MSGVRLNPHAQTSKKPADKKPDSKPQQAPAEDDGLFRDDLNDDGWRKKDGPGSSGGYGIRTTPSAPIRNDNRKDDWEDGQLDLFRDTVDIDFSRKPSPRK